MVHPHSRGYRISLKKLPLLLCLCWACSLLLTLPLFFVMKYNQNIDFCTEVWPEHVLPTVYGVLWFLYGGLPIPIMGYLYVKIIRVLWFERRTLRTGSINASRHLSAAQISRRKACKLSITVTALYTVSWFPILVLYILSFHSPSIVEYGSIAYKACVALTCLNSSVNPFVYALQSHRFRKCVKELCYCR